MTEDERNKLLFKKLNNPGQILKEKKWWIRKKITDRVSLNEQPAEEGVEEKVEEEPKEYRSILQRIKLSGDQEVQPEEVGEEERDEAKVTLTGDEEVHELQPEGEVEVG